MKTKAKPALDLSVLPDAVSEFENFANGLVRVARKNPISPVIAKELAAYLQRIETAARLARGAVERRR